MAQAPCYYECRYLATDVMYREYVRRVLCRRIFLIGALVALVSLVALGFSLREGDRLFATLFGSCLIIVLLTMVLSPPLLLRQIRENEQALHGGRKYETVVRFGNRILIREGSFSLAVDYGQIRSVRPMKHCCVLMFGPRSAVMVSPDHFTIGTYADFLNFVKNRCS